MQFGPHCNNRYIINTLIIFPSFQSHAHFPLHEILHDFLWFHRQDWVIRNLRDIISRKIYRLILHSISWLRGIKLGYMIYNREEIRNLIKSNWTEELMKLFCIINDFISSKVEGCGRGDPQVTSYMPIFFLLLVHQGGNGSRFTKSIMVYTHDNDTQCNMHTTDHAHKNPGR